MKQCELEQLALLSEELGEAQQAIGKVLRHGYEGRNPYDPSGKTNRVQLAEELGHVLYAARLLIATKGLHQPVIQEAARRKATTVRKYLHHQTKDVLDGLEAASE